MNKNDLIAAMAEKSGLSKKDCAKALDAFTESVEDTLKAGEKISLVGFGTFEPKAYPEREGRNPRTKEIVKIAARTGLTFKAGKALKDALN
jgi:DNA-binding protein HU-beta